jgi:flagellar protein FlaG
MPRELALGPTQPIPTNEAQTRPKALIERDARVPQDVSQKTLEARRQQIVDALSEAQTPSNGRLIIERNHDTGQYIHKLVDEKTGEVIRQWPQEKFVELAKTFGEVAGLWVDKKA